MTIKFMDRWGLYNDVATSSLSILRVWQSLSTQGNQPNYGTDDLGSPTLNLTNGDFYRINDNTGPEFSIFAKVKFADLMDSSAGYGEPCIFGVMSDATRVYPQLKLAIAADRSLQVVRSGATTSSTSASHVVLASTGPGFLQENTWYQINFRAILSLTTNGFVRVNVDGQDIAALSLDNVRTAYTAEVAGGAWINSSSSIADVEFSDFIFSDDYNEVLLERRVFSLRPNIDDTAGGWVQSTGANLFGTVDDTLQTTQYMAGSTVGNEVKLGFTDLPFTPTEIDTVHLWSFMSKSDTVTRAVKHGIDSAGVESKSADIYLPQSGNPFYLERFDLDPNTAAAWTPAAVNAVKSIHEVTV